MYKCHKLYLLALLTVALLTIVSPLSTLALSGFAHKRIGISQIIEHPALDIVRKSMIQALKGEGFEEGKNLTILYENAQGNLVTSVQIASKLINSSLDVGIAISTPSAQTLLHAAQKQGSQLPIVFTAVTDPVSAKLLSHDPIYPITGVSDAPDLEKLLEVIEKVMPKLKRLGLLYNPSEANSLATITRLKKLLAAKGITNIEATINKTNDVSQAIQSLAGKVDALYFPQDNTVIAALMTVINKASQLSPSLPIILPMFSDDPDILKGILMAVGYDYKDMGRETGKIVARILRGESASNISIETPKLLKVIINTTLSKSLGLTIPKKLEAAEIKLFD